MTEKTLEQGRLQLKQIEQLVCYKNRVDAILSHEEKSEIYIEVGTTGENQIDVVLGKIPRELFIPFLNEYKSHVIKELDKAKEVFSAL